MDETPWQQINIAYPGDTRQQREQHAIAHLRTVVPAAEAAGLITSWWFIRKGAWRIRFRPSDTSRSHDIVSQLFTNDVSWTPDIYEPETNAFGGTDAMTVAHELFHQDSRNLLEFLNQQPDRRRERSLILCTAMMRAAALDLNEQGDVWAQVAEHRKDQLRLPDTRIWKTFTSDVRRLLVGNAQANDEWDTAFEDAGANLQLLREAGKLTRGLRAVIALQVIFHWNRIGIPAPSQATLARAATDAIFDSEPELQLPKTPCHV